MPATLERPSVDVRRFQPALHAGYQQRLIELVRSILSVPAADAVVHLDAAIQEADARQQVLASEGIPSKALYPKATKLYFSQTKPDNIKEVQRALIGKTSGAEAEHLAAGIRELPPLACFVQNAQHQPYARTTVRPYFERIQR